MSRKPHIHVVLITKKEISGRGDEVSVLNFSACILFTIHYNKIIFLIPSEEGGDGGDPSFNELGTRLKMMLFTVTLISLCRQSTALAVRVPLRG